MSLEPAVVGGEGKGMKIGERRGLRNGNGNDELAGMVDII